MVVKSVVAVVSMGITTANVEEGEICIVAMGEEELVFKFFR